MKIKPAAFVQIQGTNTSLYLGVKPKGAFVTAAAARHVPVQISPSICRGDEVVSTLAPVDVNLSWKNGEEVKIELSDLFGYPPDEMAAFILASSVTEVTVLSKGGLRVKSPLLPNGEITFS